MPYAFPPGTWVMAAKGRGVVLAQPDEDHLNAVLVHWIKNDTTEWVNVENLRLCRAR